MPMLDASADGAPANAPIPDASEGVDAANDVDAAQREQCRNVVVCPADLICHIDGTCIEPGVADENGIATLQRAVAGHANGGGIGAIAATDDAVFWFDRGTWNWNDYHGKNASIRRMDFASGATSVLVPSFEARETELIVDGQVLYHSTVTAPGVGRVGLDGTNAMALAIPMGPLTEHQGLEWAVSSGLVYYARMGPVVMRNDVATGVETEIIDAGEGAMVRYLVADGRRVFIEVQPPESQLTQLWVFEPEQGAAEIAVESFRPVNQLGVGLVPFVVHRDWVLFSDGSVLTRLGLRSGERIELAHASEHLNLVAAHGAHAYYTDTEPVLDSVRYRSITRVGLSGGEPEVLRRANYLDLTESLAVTDDTLYWVEDHRLLSMAL
jgi:hypothetical protein